MAEETLFTKIINGEIPADIVYQEGGVTAFRDINPRAPTHVLIVPDKPIPGVNEVAAADAEVLGKLFLAAKKIAEQENIAADGYRLIINCGRHAHQEVFHLHMHLLGGRDLGCMVAG